LNVVAIEPRTHNVIIKRAYDTSSSVRQSRQLSRDLKNLAKGTIIMAAVKEDAAESLTTNVQEFFGAQGSKEIFNLDLNENWVFIGVKDQNKFTEKRGPGVGVGLILSFSETVKTVKKKFKATEGGSRIEFESAGYADGNFASITVENEPVLTREQAKRGINVVALDGRTHKVIFTKVYDTHAEAAASKALAADFSKAPKGSVIIAVIKDEAQRLLTNEARDAFAKMGSEEIRNLAYRDAWGFVGVSGQKVFGEQRAAKGSKVRAAMTLSYSKAVKE